MSTIFDDLRDGFAEFDKHREADSQKSLARRERIRETNAKRPRCAVCEADMPVSRPLDTITVQDFEDPMWDWLRLADLRPGDIVCFWCEMDMHALHDRYQWGHA